MEVFQKLTNLLILDNLNVIINGLYKKKRVFFRINTTFAVLQEQNMKTKLPICVVVNTGLKSILFGAELSYSGKMQHENMQP